MKEKFLKIRDHNGLAAFFDTTYSDLSKILYKTETRYNYKKISILKKNGSFRIIKAPRKKIKTIQKKLSDVLYEIYPVRPSVFGFVKGKNIVQNAEQHIGKTFIFNLDLKNFFDYIHFGRVRNLFRSHGRLVGVALEGAIKDTGNNAALCCTELKKVKCEINKLPKR
jgi:hypothetical protein